MNPPTNVRALRERGVFELTWPEGRVDLVPFKYVRGECPCASCIEEWTGRKLLDLNTIPADIVPIKLAPSGNYALKIEWSDGHNSGLYSWDLLNRICHSQAE